MYLKSTLAGASFTISRNRLLPAEAVPARLREAPAVRASGHRKQKAGLIEKPPKTAQLSKYQLHSLFGKFHKY